MGDYDVTTTGGSSTAVYGPPPPPPTGDDKKKVQNDPKPAAPAPPPNAAELKKITNEVKSLGVRFPEDKKKDWLDKDGNIRADKAEEVQKFLKAEAGKRKDNKDLVGSARLYQKIVALTPNDKEARVDAAKAFKAWADSQPKTDTKLVNLKTALELLKPSGDADQTALFIDYSKEFATLSLKAKKGPEGRHAIAQAAKFANEQQLDGLHEFLGKPENAALLNENEHPWMFLGDALAAEGKFGEACFAYNRGQNAANKDKNIPLRDDFGQKFKLAFEGKYPPVLDFVDPLTGQVANPVAAGLYKALKSQGFAAADMDKPIDGKDADGKISAQEVYKFISDNINDPKIQEILTQSGINLNDQEKKDAKTLGLGLFLADKYTKEAERLKKEDAAGSVDMRAKLLTFATSLDPENPKRAEALGDFFAEQKAYPLAMQAYSEALNAARAVPPPDKNPRAMEGYREGLAKKEEELKGKIKENFDKGVRTAAESAKKLFPDDPYTIVTPEMAKEQLQVLQGVQSMYDLYTQLYPEDMKTPGRLQEQAVLNKATGKALKIAGKTEDAKVFFEKAIGQFKQAIAANKNDASFCIYNYRMIGVCNDEIGNYRGAVWAYNKASQVDAFSIQPSAQLPTLQSVKFDRGSNPMVIEPPKGNYVLSDVHDIDNMEGYNAIPPHTTDLGLAYTNKIKQRIEDGAVVRETLRKENPPDFKKIYESLNEEAKMLTWFGRKDEAANIGKEATELKATIDNEKLGKEVEVLKGSGLLDQKGLDAVSEKENKGQATPLKFGDYVKFEKGSDGKSKLSFTPAYDSLDTESKNRVMKALISAGQRTQISQAVDKAQGPSKLFLEGQLAIFDDNRELAKTKLESFAKEVKDTKDPKLAAMLKQADGQIAILGQDGKQKPEDVLRDLRTMLSPLAMTLKPGQDGGIDLSAISKSEVKNFADFKKYLADQVSVDGVSFNAVLFASYEKVMTNPKHEALLKQLYKQFDGSADAPNMSVAEMQSALRDFQKDIIDVSAGRFVGNHLGNAKGRDQLRTLLQDPNLDKSIKAKLCEEVIEMGEGKGYTPPHIASLFQSKVNSHGFYFQEDKLSLGVSYAMRVLSLGDQKDVASSKQIEKYSTYPHEVQRLSANELDHSVTPEKIKEMAKLVKDLSGKSDGNSMMKCKLATMYLAVVDNENWTFDKSVDRFKDRVTEKQRAEMANALKGLLEEANGIKSNEDFSKWNNKVRRFIRGQGAGKDSDVAGTAREYLGKGVGDLTGDVAEKFNWVVSKTPEDAFKGMVPSVAGSYNDILRYVDEVHVSELHGVPVEVLPSSVSVSDPAQREKAENLIFELQGMKRGFWYNYQQRNMLSRNLSETAAIAGMGDIASINNANKEIDAIIEDVKKAKTNEDFEAIKARITRATKAGGAIHEGFKESEMDGSEQMINLVQTIAEIVVITYVTQGIGTEAALGRAAVTLGQTAARTRNLRMAYQAFQEVRTVANAARAAELMEVASVARYGSMAGELRSVAAGASEIAEAQKMFSGGARLAQALGGEAGWGFKAATGFKTGVQISLTENVLGTLSGQLKTEPTTILDWLKDAGATGFSMVVSAGLNPTFGKSVEESVVKSLFQRYVANGAKGALHFLGDTGLEVIEEVVDNYVRKKLDGDFSKLSWDELRDITMVCFAGGVKQGVTSHLASFTKGKIVDLQVKRYQEGFEARGEKVVQDPKLGYVLVDSEGGFIRKTDELGLKSFLAFEAENNSHAPRGIELISFDSTEKGSKGYVHVSDLEIFPVVDGDKHMTADEMKLAKAKVDGEAQQKASEKVKADKTKKLFIEFLEKDSQVKEVKRKDGVVIGLELVDAHGRKVRDATADEFEAFKTFNKLTEGFSLRGEKIVGSVAKGYQLVDSQGNTIRQATAPELTLYLKHKQQAGVKSKFHGEAVDRIIGEIKSDLEKGAEVRLKTQAVDKVQLSDANDPAARAKETDGKVQYFVKIKPDGSKASPTDVEISKFQAGKVDPPIVLGIEMVDKDGKVIREDLTTNHLEAFEAWKKQEKKAPVDAALKEAGIKAKSEDGQKLHGDLLKLHEEGKISKSDLKLASGEGLSKTKVAELESQLGIPRSQWLAEMAKDPAAFKARMNTIEVTRAKAEDVVSKITSGANRAEVKTQILADLKKAGVEISTNTEKAVDSMIDLTLTAQKNGIVGMEPGQLSPGQMASLLTTLYLNQSPSVRIGGAEITHVPMVVEGTLSFLLTDNPKATASEKRVAFVTALFHDAGKWDPNMRTESGFTVKQHPFFNPTGMDLEIKPGENLEEGLNRLVKEGKLSADDKAKVKIPGYLISVIAHHDSKNVHDAMSNLESQGILKKGEGAKVWQAIERHGLISSWILDNSFGGIGVLSHVFNKPEFSRYVELYQSINGRLAKGEKVNLGVLSTDQEVTELRQIFSSKFSPLERAMLLGDHQGQIDVAKYLDILSTVYQNPVADPNVPGGKGEVIVTPQNAKVGDVFFARDPRIQSTHGVLGVIQKHALEQSMVDSTQGIFAAGPSERAQAWVTGDGLVQAINPKETRDKATGVQKEFRDWAATNGKDENSPAALKEWMGTIPLFKQSVDGQGNVVLEKNAQGKPIPDPRFTEIRDKTEKAFYQWYALNDAKPLEIHQAHDGDKVEAKKPKQDAVPKKAVEDSKSTQTTEWFKAFETVTLEPIRRKGVGEPVGIQVHGVTAENAHLFMKDADGKYWASGDQYRAFTKFRSEVKSQEDIKAKKQTKNKEEVKAKVLEIGAKLDAKQGIHDSGNLEIRDAARAAAVDVLFNPNAKGGATELSNNVETVVSVVQAMDPVFRKMNPDERAEAKELVVLRALDGTLDSASAKKLAERVENGEHPNEILYGKPKTTGVSDFVDATIEPTKAGVKKPVTEDAPDHGISGVTKVSGKKVAQAAPAPTGNVLFQAFDQGVHIELQFAHGEMVYVAKGVTAETAKLFKQDADGVYLADRQQFMQFRDHSDREFYSLDLRHQWRKTVGELGDFNLTGDPKVFSAVSKYLLGGETMPAWDFKKDPFSEGMGQAGPELRDAMKKVFNYQWKGPESDSQRALLETQIKQLPQPARAAAELWVLKHGEMKQLLADLKRGSEGDPKGKVLLVTDGVVHLETVQDVKDRIKLGADVIKDMQAHGVNLSPAQAHALMERLAKKPGKVDKAFVETAFGWALKQAAELEAGMPAKLPKGYKADITVRFLKGDLTLEGAKSLGERYVQMVARFKALGVQDFEQRFMDRIKASHPDFETSPSAAMERSLGSMEESSGKILPILPQFTVEERAELMGKIADGHLPASEIQDLVVAKVMDPILNGLPKLETAVALKDSLKQAKGAAATPTAISNLEAQLAAHGPRKVLAEHLSAMLGNFSLSSTEFLTLAKSLEGLDPKSQVALLANLVMQTGKIDRSSNDHTSKKQLETEKEAVLDLLGRTKLLANQMKPMSEANRQLLLKEVAKGRLGLELKGEAPAPGLSAPNADSNSTKKVNKGSGPNNVIPIDEKKTVRPPKPGSVDADSKVEIPTLRPPKLGADIIPFQPKSVPPPSPELETAKQIADPAKATLHDSLTAAKGDAAKTAEALAPFEALAKAIEPHSKELAEGLRQDIETLKAGDDNSFQYKEALGRTKALQTILRAEGPENLNAARLTKFVGEAHLRPELERSDERIGDQKLAPFKMDRRELRDAIQKAHGNPEMLAKILDPLSQIADFMEPAGKVEAKGLRQDIETLKSADPNSPEWQSAAQRLMTFNFAFREQFGMQEKNGDPLPKGTPYQGIYSPNSATSGEVAKAANIYRTQLVDTARHLADPGKAMLRDSLAAAKGDAAKVAEALAPFEALSQVIEKNSKERSELLAKDVATIKAGKTDSPEYQAALKRLRAVEMVFQEELPSSFNTTEKLDRAVEQALKKPMVDDTSGPKETPGADLDSKNVAGGATAVGILAGAIALFSPELAHAADGAARDISSRGGVGPTEAAIIVGIGLLVAGPTIIKKYFKKGPPTPPAVTKDHPIKVESDTKKGTIYPYSKADMKNAGYGTPGKINPEDSMVIGEKVYLSLDTVLPGEKFSQPVLPMSIEDAKRLGVEFDAQGNIKKVPSGEFVYYEGTPKGTDDIAQAAKGMEVPIAPPDTPVALKDADGNVSQLRPLSVTDTGKDAGAAVSYGKAVDVEIGKGPNDPVKVKVEIYDPADPESDPKALSFGLSKPKVLEARTFEMSRAEAIQLGILRVDKAGDPPVLAGNAVLALNDEAGNVHRNNRVYIPTSNEGGYTFYPSKAMGKKERLVGDIVKVDPELTSRQGDTVYVWMRTPTPGGDAKGKLLGAEPVPMSLADARKLGIYLGHDGKLKVVSNEFIMTPVTKQGDQVLVGGKPIAGEINEGDISVMFRLHDGKIEMSEKQNPQAPPKAEILPPQAPVEVGGKKIPDALKVLGPLGVGLFAMAPDTAHAATQLQDAAATGGWMAAAGLGLTMILGMAWWSGGGKSNTEVPTHQPMVPRDGVTRFEIRVGADGQPTIVTGINQQTAMTFEQGADGQWYAHEGDPPAHTAQGVQGNWKPIKNGDLIKVFNPHTGEAYIIPFQAPKDAWIPGYAPSVAGRPAQEMKSGPLPVGKLTEVNPFVDDRPFTIGQKSGTFRFSDGAVADPHLTIERDINTGKYYLINGSRGDGPMNQILVGGMPMGKWTELSDGDYFAIRGADGQLAYFQFKDPKIAAGRASAGGYVVLEGQSYHIKAMKLNENAFGTGALYGAVTYGSPIPGDPAGSITLAIHAGPNFNADSPDHRTRAITVTAQQAKALGIVIGQDGRPLKPVTLKLTPGVEQQAMDEAAKANVAVPLPPQPQVAPAPKLKAVPAPTFVTGKFNNQSFKVEPHAGPSPAPDGAELGKIARITPYNKGGSVAFVTEINYGNPQKSIKIDMTPTELKALGMTFDAEGKPATWPGDLRVFPGEVEQVKADPGKSAVVADPREGPVELKVKKTDVVKNGKGEPVGQAHMVLGGEEGQTQMVFADGSHASAKTTKGARSYQEDGTYLGQFKLPNGTEIKVIAGADGAGGMGGGDVASSAWLQGIHAQAAKATAEGRVPTADELFKAGMMALAEQKKHAGPGAAQATGAGSVVVMVGDTAMIASAGDAMVALSRRKPNGDYETVGYTHIDNAGSSLLVNAISSNTPQLYVVKGLKPGDRFHIASDGGWENLLGVAYKEKGSKFMRGNEPGPTQETFGALNQLSAATLGDEAAADRFHDLALGNIQNPGQKVVVEGREIQLPKEKDKDNIFAISFEQGEKVQQVEVKVPDNYQALEPVAGNPAPAPKPPSGSNPPPGSGSKPKSVPPPLPPRKAPVGASSQALTPDLESRFARGDKVIDYRIVAPQMGIVFEVKDPNSGAISHVKATTNDLKAYQEWTQRKAAEDANKPPQGPSVVGPTPGDGQPVNGNLPGLTGMKDVWTYRPIFSGNEVIIGRAAFPTGPNSGLISGRHLRIFKTENGYFLQDLGSTNGTAVVRNGEQVFAWRNPGNRAPAPTFALHPGDQIVLGGRSVTFQP